MHWNPLDYDSTFEDASRLVADHPEKDIFEIELKRVKPVKLASPPSFCCLVLSVYQIKIFTVRTLCYIALVTIC